MNMTWFFDLLSTALYTVFIQNLVFNGGYAASEALMLAKKPRRLWMFSAMIAFFSTVTALACRALEMIPVLSTLPSALHFAMFSGVLIVVFLITGLILKLALGATEKFLGTLGMAALNTLVLATPLLNRSAAYTLPESIGSGIGALLGNVLPFSAEGIDFAMTALFVVIMVEQWMESKNRPSVLIGLGCGLVCLLIFGADNFILPTMICIMLILLPCRKFLDKETDQKKEVEHHAG